MDEIQENKKADVESGSCNMESNEIPISTKGLEDFKSDEYVLVDKEKLTVLMKMDEDIQNSLDITINAENVQGSDVNVSSDLESILTKQEFKKESVSDKEVSISKTNKDVQSSSNAIENDINIKNITQTTENTSSNNLLMNEHPYASMRMENSEKSMAIPNIDDNSFNLLSNPGQAVLDNVMYANNSTSFVKEEIILCEEIIIENNEYDAYVNKQNIKNTNLSNELASHDMARDLFYIDKQTSLAAIAAQYNSSDSENEVIENATEVTGHKDYRNKEIVLSSDDTSDSESDSSSSDSDESDTKCSIKSKKDNDSDDESDNESQAKNKKQEKKVFKPKSEFDDLPPIEDLTISVPEVLCDPLGEVAWTVEQIVVVRPKAGKPTLNLDTVLFIDKGQRALGHIFDVFGQVTQPHYCVRFNSSEHIQEKDIKVGMTVYYCPNTPYTSLVFLSELTKMKAVDDIGKDEAPQFSDDEEEQAYLASVKNKQTDGANKAKEQSSETPIKRKRGNRTGWQSNHPWNGNREHQSHPRTQNSRPFYRTHHPW